MDVVLLQLPFWGVGCPPLGSALLKSYLNENDISCKVFDINAHAYSLRGEKYFDWWDLKNGYYFFQNDRDKMLEYYKDNRALFLYYMDKIIELNPKVVGCTCHNTSLEIIQIFLEELRRYLPDSKFILGGPEVAGFMNNADDLLKKSFIDAVSLDEGEIALLNYVHNLGTNTDKAIDGVVYKKDGKIIRGGTKSPVKNLDELPFPDFSDFDMEYYFKPSSLSTYTSRGCVNKCIFCSGRAYMKHFRMRSGKRIFEEMQYLKEKYPSIDYFRLADNVSNGNIKELESLCDELITANKGIKWTLDNAVIRKEMRTPLYKKLKKAGCSLIGYGMETPSHKLLEHIGKYFSKGVNIPQVLKEGKKAGIYISVNVMFGLPGETEEDFEYMMKFIVKNRRNFNMLNPSLTFCEFYPGSSGYDEPEKFGLDITKGSLFWESVDGTNTYLIRMRRFEEFCKIAKKYQFDTLFDVEELPNKHSLLFQYYFISGDYGKALEHYGRIETDQISPDVKRMWYKIKNGHYPEKEERSLDFLEKEDKLKFRDIFLESSMKSIIEQLEQTDVFKLAPQKAWKRKLRSLAHKIIGYDKIEAKINSVYSTLKIIDAKISSYGDKGK